MRGATEAFDRRVGATFVDLSGGGGFAMALAPDSIQKILVEEQRGGWELVSTVQRINPDYLLLFFKRPKA
jgi:hypothetical protein